MNYRKLLEQRMEIRQRSEYDEGFRKEVLKKCIENPIFWINNFAYTFDPRESNRNLPFILWDRQTEYILWIEKLLRDQDDGVVEKSRDTGVSYCSIAIIVYHWLFSEFNALIGSRVADKVDKYGDPDSLFWKIDYILEHLPPWMLPEGFKKDRDRTYMRLSRPDNENVIVGESSNPNFGRAGRYNITLFDELAFWNDSRASWESSGSSTPTRLGVSTPPQSGTASFFYKLRQSGKVKVFSFHYKDDPRRDEAWEQRQRERQSAEEFERERNISYAGSTEGKVYASQFILIPRGKCKYNPMLPLYVSWDFGLDGVAIQWWQWDMSIDKWYKIDSYYNTGKGIEFYVPFITGQILTEKEFKYTAKELEMIRVHANWKGATHFGDPDVRKKSIQTADTRSTKSVLEKYGIFVNCKEWNGRTHYDMRQKAIMFMRKIGLIDEDDEFFTESMMQSSYPQRSENSQSTSPITSPIHNIYSHHRSCFEYMADNLPELSRKEVHVVSSIENNPLVPKDIY